jgi:hypothetical protein
MGPYPAGSFGHVVPVEIECGSAGRKGRELNPIAIQIKNDRIGEDLPNKIP